MNTSINNLILQWNELKNSANSCINSQNFDEKLSQFNSRTAEFENSEKQIIFQTH